MMKPSLAALLSVLVLAACASSASMPLGLSLPPGPDHGHIAQGVYHDKHDWFSVDLPFHPGEEGYDNLYLEEEYPKNVSFIAFTPNYPTTQGFISDSVTGEYYRVYVEDFYADRVLVPELPQVADMAMNFLGKQLVQQRIEPLHLVEERPWQQGAKPGLMRFYTQKVPAVLVMQNLGMAEDYTADILMYVTSAEGKVFVVWTEWPLNCTRCRPVQAGPATKSSDPIDQALAANARAAAFIASFALGKGI